MSDLKMDADLYLHCKNELINAGYKHEIDWQTGVQPCSNHLTFSAESVWVILNSGMKEQIARLISQKINSAIIKGEDISTAFGHKGKVAAIKYIRGNSERLFLEYCNSTDKISYLQTLPFIGAITKWHLAKNLGIDCIKPDRHLVRIAKNNNTTPDILCKTISDQTGDKISVVDIVLWRSANLGMI